MVWQIVYRPPTKYPNFRFTDGDTRAVRLAEPDPEFAKIVQEGQHAFGYGFPIGPEGVPSNAAWGAREALYDFLTLSGATIISGKLKDLVEAIEPDVHQYFPLKVSRKNGTPIGFLWIWIVCSRIDSVDRKITTWILKNNFMWMTPQHFKDSELPPGYDRSLPLRMAFNAEQSRGYHFWRDKYVGKGRLFCSNEAAAAINSAKMVGLQLLEEETV